MPKRSNRVKKVNLGLEGETPREIINRKTLKKVNLGEEGATPRKFIPSNSFELRKVNVGLDGLTPKKVVNSDGTTKAYNFLKSVNVGEEGHTPIKTFEFYSNIPVAAAPNLATFAKTTPAISNPISRSPPNRNGIPVVIKTSPKFVRVHPEVEAEHFSPGGSSRPKTSRGKSHPSPDEFFDYVVPSPPATKYADRIIFVNESNPADSTGSQANDVSTDMGEVDDEEEDTDITGNYDMLDLNAGEESETATEDANFIEGEEEIYETNGADDYEDNDEIVDSEKLVNRHNHMSGLDEQRNKQIRMLGCWLFGSALRI